MKDARADRFARQFLKDDAKRLEDEKSQRPVFPFFTIVMMTGASFVYYYWNHWNFERAKRNFVFTEMNMLQGNPHSALIQPVSFEIPYYFLMNIPGILISGLLLERTLGTKIMVGLFLAN